MPLIFSSARTVLPSPPLRLRLSIRSSSTLLRTKPPRMDRCLLLLSGKSPSDLDLARSLADGNRLGLRPRGADSNTVIPTDVRVVARVDRGAEPFGFDAYMGALRTRSFGRLLIWTPLITSTHDLIQQNFEELPVGTVCLADAQSKGRGRVTNVWESPAGCIMLSYFVQMENGRVLPFLQYVVSLAVTEAIRDLCQDGGLPRLDLKIKWPNDIYLSGLKVGGISCNSSYRSGKFNVSTGVGLNLDNRKPTTCLNAVLEDLGHASRVLKREDVISSFFNKFELLFENFLTNGFAALEDLYYKTWLHSGQKVTIEEKLGDQAVEEMPVTIQGLTSSGYLLAVDDENITYELSPDGNSLDFFKGLIRRKL